MVGDGYTNDIRGDGGNPLICAGCYTDKEDTRRRWIEKVEEYKNIKEFFWNFISE
jgi:hypothetical protein